jgi:Tol biopolymer transport system component
MIGLGFLTGAGEPSGRIAFVSGSALDDRRVCVVNLPSGAIEPIGPGNSDGAPVWSADGGRLAFESDRPGGRGIYVVRADGVQGRFLNHAGPRNFRPRWSLDGRKLAYDTGEGPDSAVMVYDLAVDQEKAWGGERKGLMRPIWMRDGSLLAVGWVGEPGRYSTDMFVVGEGAAEPLPAQALPSKGRYVEWAAESHPRGHILAFESNDGGDREIFVVTLKRGAFDVTNHRDADWNPVWSPDGKWLAFESFRDGLRSIYRVFPDTLRVFPVAVTRDGDSWCPTWSPDGQWIAFVSDRTGNPEIFVAHVTGRSVRQLTQEPREDYAPAWQPRGKR